MTKFYANENLDADLVKAMRALGYDVLTSYEANQANQGISDEAVLQYATSNNRCVLTFDRGDFLELHRSMTNHCGIIACKEASDSYVDQVQVLDSYLKQGQVELKNRLIRLLKRNQPESRQQVFVVREYFR